MSTYSEFIKKPRSKKITLAWVEPSQELLLWALDSGAIYKRSVNYWVIDILDNGTSLTKASSSSLNAGEWFFDEDTYEVYVRRSDDSNPQSHITVTYRFYFSDQPTYLPWDLSSGKAVHYDERIDRVSDFSQKLDDRQVGIALEGRGSIGFINSDGYFDDIFDVLFWENKRVKIFSYSPELDSLTEIQTLFEGLVNDKNYSSRTFSLKINDYLSRLREELPLSVFTDADGTLDDSTIGKAKRRIYGRVDNLRIVNVDQTLEGYSLTGTISGSAATTTITGSGTDFLNELLQGDTIILGDYSYSVDAIASDTSLTVTSDIEASFSGQSAVVDPDRNYPGKSRVFHVSGDKLSAPTTTVSRALEANKFELADSSGFDVGDQILVNSEYRTITRVSNSIVFVSQNFTTKPLVGDSVSRSPIYNVYYNKKQLLIDRDYSVTNTTECKITLTNSAEFNIADIKKCADLDFTNSSRNIVYAGEIETILKPGDWIRSDEIAHQTWYKVSEISGENTARLTAAYGGTTNTHTAVKREPEYIGDDSVVTADVSGREVNGKWIQKAPEVVKDILETDLGVTNVNDASFTSANGTAFYRVSYTIPSTYLGKIPKAKAVIDDMNQSVFGSLITNTDYEAAYRIVDTTNPEDQTVYKDDDIYDFSVKSKIDVASKVIGRYRHFDSSRYTADPGSKAYTFTNAFVNKNIGIIKERSLDIYLYESEYAEIIIERYAYLWSLTRSTINISTNLLFAQKSLGDRLIIDLDRIYKRYGQQNRMKIGIIQGIKKNGSGTSIELEDLGNMFNRTANISQNSTNEFGSSTDTERLLYGFIVDNTLLVPDTSSETELGSNLIG